MYVLRVESHGGLNIYDKNVVDGGISIYPGNVLPKQHMGLIMGDGA